MPISQLSLAVVGMRYPNKKRGNRQFEITVCKPGEPVRLVHEPRNPADQDAIAVFSCRDIQMGYVSAERTMLVHRAWQAGEEVRAIFQNTFPHGAWIRVTLDGSEPVLPPMAKPGFIADNNPDVIVIRDDDPGFWPDEIPPDE